MKKWFEYFLTFYEALVVSVVTALIFLFLVFGGEFHIKINFSSYKELINNWNTRRGYSPF
jgi:hypothetical protein